MAARSCLYALVLFLAFQSTMIQANIVLTPPQCRPVLASSLERIQFLLNLIIYKAEFFLRASTGRGIDDIAPGLVQGPVPVGATVAALDNDTRRIIEELGLICVGHISEVAGYGVLRAQLYSRVNSTLSPYTFTVGRFYNLSAELDNRLGGCGMKDEGLFVPLQLGAENRTTSNVVPADVNSLAYARYEREILGIVFGNGNATRPGAIFPAGFNGILFRRIVL
ncbi:hypothetical protein V6N13_002914 [Hibiscus sabdariffa]|uniref:Uncharacterized protein n=1 Tax=Hibiscus sabdariffa TaxID=183260 RepID=A0ABR2NXX6_9ROSI